MNEWNIKEANCKIKAFSVGLVFGIALVLLFAWDKIVSIH